MANWDGGYVTDIPYTNHFHRETTPVWIATACTLLGFGAPDIGRPFRYADLGCGNGLTALIVAATMPHAEVWGFDFNPAHVEAGRDMARRAGLTNIRFQEASFEEMAALAPDALPEFDYIVAHGILSWVSRENHAHLFRVAGQRLAAGGVMYLSYNVATGWIGVPPVQTLMRLLGEVSGVDSAASAAGILQTLESMKAAGAAMFAVHPAVLPQLTQMLGFGERYFAHEILNRNWHLMMFETVARSMAAAKCDYLGNATLSENHDGLLTPAIRELAASVGGRAIKETLRDLGTGIRFRRDLFQRGTRRLQPPEHRRAMGVLSLFRTAKASPETFLFEGAGGSVAVTEAIYRPLLAQLHNGPVTVDALVAGAAARGHNAATVFEVLTMFLNGAYVEPLLTEPPAQGAIDASARLNAVFSEMFDLGQDYPLLAVPAAGTGFNTDSPVVMALGELRAGRAADAAGLTDAIVNRIRGSGRHPFKNGQAVSDPVVLAEIVGTAVRGMLENDLRWMQLLGVLNNTASPSSGGFGKG